MDVDEIVMLVMAVIGSISAVTAAIPNASKNKTVQLMLNIINALGMNFGKNRNAP